KYMANRSYYDMHKVEGAWFSYHGEAGRRWAERQRQNDARMAAAAAHGEHGARLSDMEHHRGRAGSVFDHGAPPVPNTSEHHAENIENHRAVGRRQRMQRIQSKFFAEDMLGAPRYASQLDIGFA
ncbi:MAG TPA: hypothetical protein VHA37_10150, partial [Candidatus Saccharimonadales bacterium]|nr:hypothetical protein [Candidatus Saccharimonadales bacterium]